MLFKHLYIGLTPLQLFLLLLRVGSCLLTLGFLLSVLLVPIGSQNVYISRINCAHLDVAMGLYTSLRNSVSTAAPPVVDNSDIPVDTTLTNSEISILSEYAEAQVANAPQYITTSIWYWCYGNYNVTTTYDKNGVAHTVIANDVRTCSKTGSRYIFDYRQELEQVGLNAILAYAYEGGPVVDDVVYQELVKKRRAKYNLAIPAIIFAVVSQFVVLVLSLIAYNNRDGRTDLKGCPQILVHAIGLVSLASCVSVFVGMGIMTNLLIVIRSEIHAKLNAFGVSLHIGTVWFTLFWLGSGFDLLSMLSWIVPLWCDNPEEEEEDSFYYEYRGVDTYNLPQPSKLNKFTHKFKRSHPIMREDLVDDEDESSRQFEYFHDDENTRKKPITTDYIHEENVHENELRKLGESLSKKFSVRHTPKRKRPVYTNEVETEQVKDLLYKDGHNNFSKFPQMYQEVTYNGYVGRVDSTNDNEPRERVQTRNLSNPNSRSNSTKLKKDAGVTTKSPNLSILNDQELDLLQCNNYMK